MKRLAILLLLVLAPTASAKEVIAARVCGLDDCVRTERHSVLGGLMLGGHSAAPPKGSPPYYVVRVIMGVENGDEHWYEVTYTPQTRLLRYDDGTWAVATPKFVAAVRRTLPEGRPFPRLKARTPLREPAVDARVAAVYHPSRPVEADGADGGVPLGLLGAGVGAALLALVAFALRRTTTATPE
jgi:hypothetical protein